MPAPRLIGIRPVAFPVLLSIVRFTKSMFMLELFADTFTRKLCVEKLLLLV